MANTNDNRIVACGGGECRGAMSWTDIECTQFEQGVILHGWGNWIAMAQSVIPTRDRCQVKSHAQKFRQNHTADYERLLREHEARLRVNFPGVVVGTGRGKADTEKRRKTPPRRRASTTKAKKRAVRTSPRSFHRSATADVIISLSGRAAVCPKPHEILRGNGNLVATSSMKSATAKGSPKMKITRMQPSPFPCGSLSAVNNVVGLATMDSASPASPSPKIFDIMPTARKPPRHVGVLSDVTNDIRHATLGHSAPASTSTAFFDVEFPDRRHHAFEASIHEYPPNYDEMPALVTTVTPSSGPMPACCKSMHNASALFNIHSDDARMYTDVFGDYASLSTDDVIDRAGNEDIIDPLYQLEMDDHRLDTIGDLLEPSCNVMFDKAIKGGMLSQGIDSRDPFAVATNNGIGLVEWTMTSGRSEAFQIPPNVQPHRQLFMHVRSLLTSPTDVNNPEEYILGCAGMCRGSLCRARIKMKLGEHLTMCWWREDVFADQSGVIQSALGTLGKVVEGKVDVRIGEVQNGTVSFKKFALERLVALIAAMLDVDHWHTLRVGNSSPANANTFSDDDDDIRHVGQLLSGLWERVSRSRDGFALLGGDIQERTERNEAINTLVARLDLISRQEHIKSRRVPSYDHGWRV